MLSFLLGIIGIAAILIIVFIVGVVAGFSLVVGLKINYDKLDWDDKIICKEILEKLNLKIFD